MATELAAVPTTRPVRTPPRPSSWPISGRGLRASPNHPKSTLPSPRIANLRHRQFRARFFSTVPLCITGQPTFHVSQTSSLRLPKVGPPRGADSPSRTLSQSPAGDSRSTPPNSQDPVHHISHAAHGEAVPRSRDRLRGPHRQAQRATLDRDAQEVRLPATGRTANGHRLTHRRTAHWSEYHPAAGPYAGHPTSRRTYRSSVGSVAHHPERDYSTGEWCATDPRTPV